ncbi:MAG: L-2-amino-thiazoline-4-carboxylic acid hydrolase [Actinomycetota bacterium]|nr:L-2-amino-thiazoline-4-carboxylic acid hydrolase [Actinomycetota bacterium]
MSFRASSQEEHSAIAPAPWMVAAVRAGKPIVKGVARRGLAGRGRSRSDPTAGRFTPSQISRIVNEAFTRFEQQVPDLPSEPTLGSRQNVMLAALTLSFLEALEADGIERGYAIELTGDVCWRFYRQWGLGTRAATRLITCDPVRRLRLSVNAFLTFPFGRPGYRFDDVLQGDGRSLDMHRCPVADYLGSRGAADLCAGSWCNLDYALAEMWGGTLERSGTLVAGAGCCDFRFRVPASPEVPFGAMPERTLPMVAA